MIIIAVNGRQATLASRGELIQGNVDTIEAEFRIADGDAAAIWDGAVITAVFKIITPLGESKYATAVVNRQSGIAKIPRIPMAYGNAKLKAGLRGVFEDESVVATNMVDVGTVIEGAGGRDYDCAMGDIWKDGTVLDDFLAEIAKLTHTHLNKDQLDRITDQGDGTKFLADDGTYKDAAAEPDWEENDQSSRSYIANRTHWASTETVREEYTVEWLNEPPEGFFQNWDCENLGIELEEDAVYTLEVNGETLTCEGARIIFTAQDGYTQNMVLVGNPYIVNAYLPEQYEDNGFPFVLAYNKVYNQQGVQVNEVDIFMTYDSLFGSDLTFSIGQEETVYHKLSAVYLPDDVNDAAQKKHTHANKESLDQVDAQVIENVSRNTAARHGHTNKLVLDSITQQNVNDIVLNTAVRHSHSNQTAIDSLGTMAVGGFTMFKATGSVSDLFPYSQKGTTYSGSIRPLIHYLFGSEEQPAVSIQITSLWGLDSGTVEEYLFGFWTGDTLPTFELPSAIKFANELSLEKNKYYEVSIVDKHALWVSFDAGGAAS